MSIDKCDHEIYEKGNVVAILIGGKMAIEGMVQEASRYGPKMDWHYVAGRAVVKTLGDVDEARKALREELPQMYEGYM